MTYRSRANGRGRARTVVFVTYAGAEWTTFLLVRSLRFRHMRTEAFRRHYREGIR